MWAAPLASTPGNLGSPVCQKEELSWLPVGREGSTHAVWSRRGVPILEAPCLLSFPRATGNAAFLNQTSEKEGRRW